MFWHVLILLGQFLWWIGWSSLQPAALRICSFRFDIGRLDDVRCIWRMRCGDFYILRHGVQVVGICNIGWLEIEGNTSPQGIVDGGYRSRVWCICRPCLSCWRTWWLRSGGDCPWAFVSDDLIPIIWSPFPLFCFSNSFMSSGSWIAFGLIDSVDIPYIMILYFGWRAPCGS